MGRSAFALATSAAAWVVGLGGIAAWAVQSEAATSRIVLAAAIAILAAAIALGAWRRQTAGTLAWDGEGWRWTCGSHAETGTPEVAIDVQRVLLLRWATAGRTRWLWVEKSVLPARWDDLRRAVYSRAP